MPHRPTSSAAAALHATRRDFAASGRLPAITALAAVVGGASALAAWGLLHLIRFFTNLFFFQSWSVRMLSPASEPRSGRGCPAATRRCGRWCSWRPRWAA